MKKMLYGFTEADYIEGFTSAIASMRNHDSKYTEYLQKWHRNRGKFARYIVSHQAGSLRRHGLSHAEQNHASFVQRIGPVCLDDPVSAISAILRRHADISCERNHAITRYHLLVASRVTEANNILDGEDIKAMNFLSSWGFELWHEMQAEARNYQVDYTVSDEAHVSRAGVSASMPPRILSTNPPGPCRCRHKLALQIRCPHETAIASGDILPHLRNFKHWQQRSKLGLSYHVVPFNRDSMMPGTQSDLMSDTQSAMMPETQSDLMPDTQFDMMPDTHSDIMPDAQSDVIQLTCEDAASLTSLQEEQGQPVVQQTTTNVTYGMLKRVACELVEVASMKQSNETKRVAICGMMLRLTKATRCLEEQGWRNQLNRT
jgi:hypothetical protein